MTNFRYLSLSLCHSTGTGLVSMVAAIAGCRNVLATDFNPLALSFVRKAVELNGIDEACINTAIFDVQALNSQPLPSCDLLLIADLLYTKVTAIAVASRVVEALEQKASVIIGDSPNRPGYF